MMTKIICIKITDEKEDGEIEIGFPTDVKHVAHIGLDGPSASTPTWVINISSFPLFFFLNIYFFNNYDF